GDTRADVIGRDNSGNWWVGFSDGTKFVTQRFATWSPSINWQSVFVGDVNGDGAPDFLGRDPASGIWWASVRLPDFGYRGLTLTNVNWGTWSPSMMWLDIRADDLNNDLRFDIVGRAAGTGVVWVGLSIGADNHFVNQVWGNLSPAITWD